MWGGCKKKVKRGQTEQFHRHVVNLVRKAERTVSHGEGSRPGTSLGLDDLC